MAQQHEDHAPRRPRPRRARPRGSTSPGGHDHGDHGHAHPTGPLAKLKELFAPTATTPATASTPRWRRAAAASARCVISFVALLATTVLQAVVVVLSGSVALLGDTLHNVADALTAVPLAIAFTLGRRAATRRFTYGYGRAEDLAGLVVVLLITLSAAAAGYQAVSGCSTRPTSDASGWSPRPGSSASSATSSSPATASGRAGRSARPRSSPTACTPVPTASPRLAVVLGAIGVALGFRWPTRSSAWSSPWRSSPCCARPPARSSRASWTPSTPRCSRPSRRSLARDAGRARVGEVRCAGSATRCAPSARSRRRAPDRGGRHDSRTRPRTGSADVRRLTAAIVHAGPEHGSPAGQAGRAPRGRRRGRGVGDLVDDLVGDDALLVDDERAAQREPDLLLQHAVRPGHVTVRPEVGQQRERVALLVGPLLVHRRAVDRDREGLHVVARNSSMLSRIAHISPWHVPVKASG